MSATIIEHLPVDGAPGNLSALVTSAEDPTIKMAVEQFTTWGERHQPHMFFKGIPFDLSRARALLDVLTTAIELAEKHENNAPPDDDPERTE